MSKAVYGKLQCEVIRTGGSFMTLGPRSQTQCPNTGTLMMFEKGYKGGKEGKMPVCDDCFSVFVQKHGQPHLVLPIVTERRKNTRRAHGRA